MDYNNIKKIRRSFSVCFGFAKAILLSSFFIFTSCSDMLTVDTGDKSYTNANDTLYSYLGILKHVQDIAERQIILNELRGDLVSPTLYVTDTLHAIANFEDPADGSCSMLDISDYYAVINNCNLYIANCDTNAFVSVYTNVGLDTNANPRVALHTKDGPNGAVARGLLAGSPFAKAGCRIWYSEANGDWYIYNAEKKRYHSLNRQYTYASTVPKDDDPVPPDAFGRPRKVGHIAYGPLNASSSATTLSLR